MNKRAYVTVITNNSYLPGLRAIVRCLRKVHSKYPLYVLLPKNRCEQLLDNIKEINVRYIIKDEISIPEYRENQNHYWRDTFFKLQAASLTEFDKVILIDSDMLLLNNIDHLFERHHLTACVAGKLTNPEWTMFNSGLMVLKPSKEYFLELVNCIHPTIIKMNNLPCGDQDVFQQTCLNWASLEELHLPCEYNLFEHEIEIFKTFGKKIYIIHFAGKNKPWFYSRHEIRKKIKRLLHSRHFYSAYYLNKYWKLTQ